MAEHLRKRPIFNTNAEYKEYLEKQAANGNSSAEAELMFYHHGGDVIEETDPDSMQKRWE